MRTPNQIIFLGLIEDDRSDDQSQSIDFASTKSEICDYSNLTAGSYGRFHSHRHDNRQWNPNRAIPLCSTSVTRYKYEPRWQIRHFEKIYQPNYFPAEKAIQTPKNNN